MTLSFPEFPEGVWVRTCQECGHRQAMKKPDTTQGEAWRDVKCKKCKSHAMDYGQLNTPVAEETE